jgi:uncharacterized membrane protein
MEQSAQLVLSPASIRVLVVLIVPISLVVLAIPLVLEKVPRNYFYGFRTRYTLSSDAVWYRANKISGITLLIGGTFWLFAGTILMRVMDSERTALALTGLLGGGALMIGGIVSFWLTYRKN